MRQDPVGADRLSGTPSQRVLRRFHSTRLAGSGEHPARQRATEDTIMTDFNGAQSVLRARATRLGAMALAALSFTFLASQPAFAEVSEETAYIFNTLLFLIGGFLVMWMAAGFAMLESGLVRSKNTTEILTKNVALYAIACIMYLVCGYAIMYGGNVFLSGIADVDVDVRGAHLQHESARLARRRPHVRRSTRRVCQAPRKRTPAPAAPPT